MKKVKITFGAYGQHVRNLVVLRDIRSNPFELDDAEAERLVSLGIAKIIEESPVSEDESVKSADSEGTEHEEYADDDVNEDDDTDGAPHDDSARPEYSAESSVSELREIAKACGITFSVGTTKVQMVAELDEYFDNNGSSAEMPNFVAGDPVS